MAAHGMFKSHFAVIDAGFLLNEPFSTLAPTVPYKWLQNSFETNISTMEEAELQYIGAKPRVWLWACCYKLVRKDETKRLKAQHTQSRKTHNTQLALLASLTTHACSCSFHKLKLFET